MESVQYVLHMGTAFEFIGTAQIHEAILISNHHVVSSLYYYTGDQLKNCNSLNNVQKGEGVLTNPNYIINLVGLPCRKEIFNLKVTL